MLPEREGEVKSASSSRGWERRRLLLAAGGGVGAV